MDALDAPKPNNPGRWLFAAALVIAGGALVAHSLVYNFVTDDAFISFVYSRNLVEHGQLVFNLGERVEGYTNFLWTVMLAGLMKVGLAPEIMSRVLGTGFALATFFILSKMTRRVRGAKTHCPWDATVPLLLACVPGYACWSSGGLETQMFTFFVTYGVAGHLVTAYGDRKSPLPTNGMLLGLSALTRPEGLFFFGLIGLDRAYMKLRARDLRPTRAELRWVAMFLLPVVPHLLWRRWYYGWWLPNTFYIKASGGAGAWGQGLYYWSRVILDYHLWMIPLLIVGACLAGGLRDARYRTLLRVGAVIIGPFFVYVTSVGGDFMGLYRFVMPIFPLLFLICSASLRIVIGKLTGGRSALVFASFTALLLAYGFVEWRVGQRAISTIGADRGIDTPGFLRWYTADRAAIGRWFGQHAQPDDFAAVGGAGAQVYYSGMRSLDCFGLSDEYIAHHVSAVSSRPGHQKYAPLEYQLSRKPTIITSNYYRIAGAPFHPSPAEAAEWRRRGYHYVSVEIPGLSSPWYTFLKRLDRRVGPFGPESE